MGLHAGIGVNMKVRGLPNAYALLFETLNKLGLTDAEAYAVKKQKELDVDDKIANKLIEKGWAVAIQIKKPKSTKMDGYQINRDKKENKLNKNKEKP